MDGVITNTMPDHYHAWKVILAEEGIHATHYDIYSREGQRGISSVEEIFNHYKKTFTPQVGMRILKDKETYFKKIVKERYVPGTRTLLKRLHQMGFKLALVTGTSKHELHRILPSHLYDLFDVIVTGNDVKNGKPHPEPYLKAIDKLGIKPREAVVIENAPFGIRSAKAAGLKCLALETSLPKKYLKGADDVFSSTRELEKKVSFCLR